MKVLTTGASHFVGFHDVQAWSPDGEKLLCLRTETPEDRVPGPCDVAEVGLIPASGGEFIPVASTHCWNWQQGARQMWVDALGGSIIVFNQDRGGVQGSCVLDVNDSTARWLPFPVFDVHGASGRAVGLNFKRLHALSPGYGYAAEAPELAGRVLDGLYEIDLDTGSAREIVSLSTVVSWAQSTMGTDNHYLTHASISPEGSKLAFLHRCVLTSGGVVTNLFVSDWQGHSYSALATDKVSHFTWLDETRLLAWTRDSALARAGKKWRCLRRIKALARFSRMIRSPLIRTAVYHESFRVFDLEKGIARPVGLRVIWEDGHPQSHPRNPNLIACDTYPDGDGNQRLFTYNLATGRRMDVLTLRTNLAIRETPWRCDFHPRWSRDGAYVCFDSAHLGRRQVCITAVPQEYRLNRA